MSIDWKDCDECSGPEQHNLHCRRDWMVCSNCSSAAEHANHLRWLGKNNKTVKTMEIDYALWERVRQEDPQAREEVILNSRALVERIARKIWRSLPVYVELNDVVSYGMLGLFRAIDRFDPSRGVSFEIFAAASVRSLILDELRKLDWAPRSLRKKQRELDAAEESLVDSLNRDPTLVELAEQLDWAPHEVSGVRVRVEASYHKSLEESDPDGEWVSKDAGVDVSVDRSDIRAALVSLVDRIREMPVVDQVVLALYYFEGRKLSSISEELGLTDTRTSQIHGQAVTAVRDCLQGILEESHG